MAKSNEIDGYNINIIMISGDIGNVIENNFDIHPGITSRLKHPMIIVRPC